MIEIGMNQDTTTRPPEAQVFPYESPDFHQCWWEYLKPKFAVRETYEDFVVHRKSLFKGFLKLNELRLAGWNNAWAQDLTEDRVEDFRTFSRQAKWDYFRMQWCVPRREHQAFHILEDLGYTVIQVPAPPHYIIDLSQGWEHYLKQKSAKNRQDVRRKLCKAESLQVEYLSFKGANGIDEFFTLFFKHHIAYWNAKVGHSYFNDPCEREFIVAWANALAQSGNLELKAMVINGEIANLSMQAIFNDRAYYILTITTGLYTEYFPGIVSLYHLFEKASELGIKTINMGCGAYEYKVNASSRQEACYDMLVVNPASVKGKLYVAWLKQHLQSFQEQMIPVN